MKVLHDQSYGIIPLRMHRGIWQVLVILHRGGNHWGFPKGHSVLSETPQQAAARELKEETGLNVAKLLAEHPKTENYIFRRKKNLISKKAHYYPALVEGELQLQEEEIVDGRWLKIEEALEILSFEEARNILREIMAELLKNDD